MDLDFVACVDFWSQYVCPLQNDRYNRIYEDYAIDEEKKQGKNI